MSPVSKSGFLCVFFLYPPPLPLQQISHRNVTFSDSFFNSFYSQTHSPQKPTSVQNIKKGKMYKIYLLNRYPIPATLSPSLSPAHHFWIRASFPSALLSLDFIQHCFTSLFLQHTRNINKERHSADQTNQTDNQPLKPNL